MSFQSGPYMFLQKKQSGPSSRSRGAASPGPRSRALCPNAASPGRQAVPAVAGLTPCISCAGEPGPQRRSSLAAAATPCLACDRRLTLPPCGRRACLPAAAALPCLESRLQRPDPLCSSPAATATPCLACGGRGAHSSSGAGMPPRRQLHHQALASTSHDHGEAGEGRECGRRLGRRGEDRRLERHRGEKRRDREEEEREEEEENDMWAPYVS